MSKATYLNGFRKTAEAYGIPHDKLARFALAKAAEGEAAAGATPSMRELFRSALGNFKNWYSGQNELVKGLVGGLGSAAVGSGLGAAFGGIGGTGAGRGAARGALLGGLIGTAGSIDWSKVKQYIDSAAAEAAKARAAAKANTAANSVQA